MRVEIRNQLKITGRVRGTKCLIHDILVSVACDLWLCRSLLAISKFYLILERGFFTAQFVHLIEGALSFKLLMMTCDSERCLWSSYALFAYSCLFLLPYSWVGLGYSPWMIQHHLFL